MATVTGKLDVAARDAAGSRAARRLRRSGRIPGVLYGRGAEPLSFDVDARELRLALASSGAVVEVSVDGAKPTPAVLKEAQRDPVRGHTSHVDLLRVRLDQPIHAVVALELAGVEDVSGVRQGGILEHLVRELNIEALPTAIPEAIVHELGEMQIGETVTRAAIAAPDGVTLLDDEEIVIATISAPRLQAEVEAEIEGETELVGEAGGEEAAGEGGSSAEE